MTPENRDIEDDIHEMGVVEHPADQLVGRRRAIKRFDDPVER